MRSPLPNQGHFPWQSARLIALLMSSHTGTKAYDGMTKFEMLVIKMIGIGISYDDKSFEVIL